MTTLTFVCDNGGLGVTLFAGENRFRCERPNTTISSLDVSDNFSDVLKLLLDGTNGVGAFSGDLWAKLATNGTTDT